MSNFLNRLVGRRGPSSAQAAKERLKLVLIHDRTDVSPGILEAMREDIVTAISKHLDIDRDGVKISVTHDDRVSRLVADIPLAPSRRRK